MKSSLLHSFTHHAVLLTHPNRKEISEKLWKELQVTSYAHRYFDQTVLDIETAREIISWAKSSYDGERVGLISFHTIGLPAQNALLKILEEPNENTRFILVTSNKENLIDTVLSRLSQHVIEEQEDKNSTAKLFLGTAPSERIKLPCITQLLSKTDEEGRKNREEVRACILSLIPILTQQKVEPRYITETLEIASYASDSSSSGKALLEYLSLLLPQIKS